MAVPPAHACVPSAAPTTVFPVTSHLRADSVLLVPLIRHPETPFRPTARSRNSSPQNHSLRLKGLTLCCPHVSSQAPLPVSSPRLSGAPPSPRHFAPVLLLQLLSPLTLHSGGAAPSVPPPCVAVPYSPSPTSSPPHASFSLIPPPDPVTASFRRFPAAPSPSPLPQIPSPRGAGHLSWGHRVLPS